MNLLLDLPILKYIFILSLDLQETHTNTHTYTHTHIYIYIRLCTKHAPRKQNLVDKVTYRLF